MTQLAPDISTIVFSTNSIDSKTNIDLLKEHIHTYKTISPQNLQDGEDFFKIYELLSDALNKKTETPLLFINIESIHEDTIREIFPTLGKQKLLYVQSGDKKNSRIQSLTNLELAGTIPSPQLLYFSSPQTQLKDYTPTPELLSFDLWNLLISITEEIPCCTYHPHPSFSENILEGYKAYMESESHQYRDDIPDIIDEWTNLRLTLHARIVSLHHELFARNFSLLLLEKEKKNNHLKEKLKIRKSEIKYLNKRHEDTLEHHQKEKMQQQKYYEEIINNSSTLLQTLKNIKNLLLR